MLKSQKKIKSAFKNIFLSEQNTWEQATIENKTKVKKGSAPLPVFRLMLLLVTPQNSVLCYRFLNNTPQTQKREKNKEKNCF